MAVTSFFTSKLQSFQVPYIVSTNGFEETFGVVTIFLSSFIELPRRFEISM